MKRKGNGFVRRAIEKASRSLYVYADILEVYVAVAASVRVSVLYCCKLHSSTKRRVLTCSFSSRRKNLDRTDSLHAMSAIHQSAPLGLGPTINTRLLRLELGPVIDTPNSMISVSLHVTSLQDAPPYRAVSYMWGEPSPTKQILLNDQPFTVRQNLWDLLNRLWETRFEGYFWVDALSIDQTSNSEKNHQVAIMGTIYIEAATTIVWLGTATHDVADKIFALGIMLNASYGAALMQRKVHNDKDPNLRIEGFKYILAHPYWTRTWILQEYILSCNVQFWCGNVVIRASNLKDVATSWLDRVATLCLTSAQTGALATIMNGAEYSTRTFPLIWLLTMTSESLCVDPRDRIYAVLSLLSPRERALWAITPDYAGTTQELFEHLCSVFENPALQVERWKWTLERWEKHLRRVLLLDNPIEEDG
jgi:hypothetical protein